MLSNQILCCTLWLTPSEMMRSSRSLHVDRYRAIWAMSKHWLKCNEEITRSHMIGLYQNSSPSWSTKRTACGAYQLTTTHGWCTTIQDDDGSLSGENDTLLAPQLFCVIVTQRPPYRATLIIAETWQSMYQCNGRCLVGGYSLLFISLGNGHRTDSSWWSVGKGCRNRYAFLLSVVLVLGQN